MPEVNSALTSPTGLLGHDGSGPGTVTPARARALVTRYAAVPNVITADTNITSSHIYNLLPISGSGVDLTLVETGWSAGDWVDILVVGTSTVSLTAGTNGINRAGNDTIVLYPDTLTRVVLTSGSDPMWAAGASDFLSLGANQAAVSNSAGAVLEARTQKFIHNFVATITANGTYPVAKHGDVPVTLNEVTVQSVSGACDYKLQKNGADFNGHGTALGVTTTKRDTACTETLAEDDLTTLVITNASSLTGIYVTQKGTRTGN